MTQTLKKFLPFLILFILIMPVLIFAQGPFVPCGGNIIDANGNITGKQPECGYQDLLKLVNNIINWIIMISVPVAAGVFAWAGFIYMTTGISDQKSYAKDMMWKVAKGLVFILAAWIIVNTITNTLLTDKYGFRQAVPVEGVKK
ncbi:MAG: hypothetical protein AAB837_01705 [Patescibacteria group bacterium]